jgi:AmmeMemoRadiSam system protein A
MSKLSEPASARWPIEKNGVALPRSEFTFEQRRTLLQIAHDAIVLFVESDSSGKSLSTTTPGVAGLDEPRGVFTTLYSDGNLRGCVGYAAAVMPLYRAVAETARAAAFEDSRFSPVSREEALKLEVSLSVLSRVVAIDPEAVEVGRDGLVISMGNRRGLLLPQVPVEQGWNRETFLEQTCRKAGLPLDAWRRGAIVEAFTAEVFSDGDTGV